MTRRLIAAALAAFLAGPAAAQPRKPTYTEPPKPAYESPKPTYTVPDAPKPTYREADAPKPTYRTPESSRRTPFTPPEPAAQRVPFNPPKPDYSAPAPAPRYEARRTDAPVVHLLAVADSSDPSIGAKVGDDARNVAALFEESFRAAGKGDQLRTRVILGRETTGRNLLAAVAGLDVRPNDAVVVFYSGHGSIDGRDRRGFDIGGGDRLAVDAVLAAIEARGPRLAVLLTDVCSSYQPGRPADRAPAAGAPRELPRGRVMPWATVEHLFLSHRGVVDITAAAPGQMAAIEPNGRGSFFTNALLEVLTTPHPALVAGLDQNGDRAIQWAEVLPQVRGAAAERFRADPPRDARATGPQVATGRALGTWAPPGRVAVGE